jgi:hypothetical protein
MGPALILDKSAFQGLGRDEHIERHFMFMENVTPVLLREVAGDLAKTPRGFARAAGFLAGGFGRVVCSSHLAPRQLLLAAASGHSIDGGQI